MSFLVSADTHVHLYVRFSVDRFLSSALSNFRRAEVSIGESTPVKVLFLTERSADSFFASGSMPVPVVQCASTVKKVTFSSGQEIFLVAGCQMVTSEGLEILALNTTVRFGDRMPFENSIDNALAGGATVIINWCFGKWWGERGRVLRRLVKHPSLKGCYVGDVPLRISPSVDQGLFSDLRKSCAGILCGSDPLPIKGDESIAGSFGSQVKLSVAPDLSSVAGVSALLRELGTRGSPYGSRNTLGTFVRRQVLNELQRHR
jgi:hypothetical protein